MNGIRRGLDNLVLLAQIQAENARAEEPHPYDAARNLQQARIQILEQNAQFIADIRALHERAVRVEPTTHNPITDGG